MKNIRGRFLLIAVLAAVGATAVLGACTRLPSDFTNEPADSPSVLETNFFIERDLPRIDFNLIEGILTDIRDANIRDNQDGRYSSSGAPLAGREIHLVLDTSPSIGLFLGDGLSTYSNILTSIADVFSRVNMTAYTFTRPNTCMARGIDFSLPAEERFVRFEEGAVWIDSWRDPLLYREGYDGRQNVGSDIYGMMRTMIEYMHESEQTNDHLYVFITDLTPDNTWVARGSIMSPEMQFDRIARLLVNEVIAHDGLTFGIIGIQAEKSGDLYGMPDRSPPGRPIETSIMSRFMRLPNGDEPPGGVYNTPIYLLFVGDERLVHEYVRRMEDDLKSRIRHEDGDIRSYVFRNVELRRSQIFAPDQMNPQLIKLPPIELSENFAPFSVGSADGARVTDPHSVFRSYNRLPFINEDYGLQFFRLFDTHRFDGTNTDFSVTISVPYELFLMPGDLHRPINAQYLGSLSRELHAIAGWRKDESLSEREAEQFIAVRGFNPETLRWDLSLRPDAFVLDVPVLFHADITVPLRADRTIDLVSEAMAVDAGWLFAHPGESDESWAVYEPGYTAFRVMYHTNRDEAVYTQAHRTPFLHTLFTQVRRGAAQHGAQRLNTATDELSTATILFGFVVRSDTPYYTTVEINSAAERQTDPLNRGVSQAEADRIREHAARLAHSGADNEYQTNTYRED